MTWVIYNKNEDFGDHFQGRFETRVEALLERRSVLKYLISEYRDKNQDDQLINFKNLRDEIDDSLEVISLAEYQKLTGDLE